MFGRVPSKTPAEPLDQSGVEAAARALRLEDRETFSLGSSGAIGSCAGECVMDVGHGQDTHEQGDPVAMQTIGIAAAVEPFVVPTDQGEHGANRPKPFQDANPFKGVPLHQAVFLVCQRPSLVENGVGQSVPAWRK
jgi:hypothetical protein